MKNVLNKIAQLNNQLSEAKSELKTEFWNELKQIFKDNPTLESVRMYVNNHEFNDGDATTFYLGYEDMTITVDGEEFERVWDTNAKDYKSNPTMDSLIELFGATQDIHEDLFSSEWESMTIDRNSVLNKKTKD